MSDYDDLHLAELPALNEGISQVAVAKTKRMVSARGNRVDGAHVIPDI
jgi:hypothetical protein